MSLPTPAATRKGILLMLLAIFLFTAMDAQAKDMDQRALEGIVASAGSGADTIGRIVATSMSQVFGQQVIIDNRTGAAGNLGAELAAKSPADGYTILFNTIGPIAVNVTLFAGKLPYDPLKDLTPVGLITIATNVIAVHPSVPANNLKELVALVKANPERYNYATWGNGSSGQLTMEWLKQKAGLKMDHIPYKTTPQIVNDLASGVLQIGWTDPGTPVPMIEANKIKALAISGNNRVPRTHNVPTMGEQGYPFESVGWFGVFGPANLPKAITDRLNVEINKVQASPEMAKRMESMNLESPPVKSAEEFKAIIASDLKMWVTIAKDANVTGD